MRPCPAQTARASRGKAPLVAQALSGHVPACIAPDVRMTHVLTSHEYAARWRAYRAPGIKPGEFHSFLGHLVETRGLDQFLAVASEIPIAEVVSQNIDNIWWVISLEFANASN